MRVLFFSIVLIVFSFDTWALSLNCIILNHDEYIIGKTKTEIEWQNTYDFYDLLNRNEGYETYELKLDEALKKKLESNRPFSVNKNDFERLWLSTKQASSNIEARKISFDPASKSFSVKTSVCNIFYGDKTE